MKGQTGNISALYFLHACRIIHSFLKTDLVCGYPRGYRTGEFRVNFWKLHKNTQTLSQVININTREDKTLDLLLSNSPSQVNRVKAMPPIGKADHVYE